MQIVLVLICVALCVVWHMALRRGGRHSPLVCVVRRASVRPVQMPYHGKSHFRVGNQ
jgi:hypothetical protein